MRCVGIVWYHASYKDRFIWNRVDWILHFIRLFCTLLIAAKGCPTQVARCWKMPTHQLCSSRMWSKGVLWIGVECQFLRVVERHPRDFLLFTLLCSLVLRYVDRLAWISHEPSFKSENFLKLDWPSRWSTVISSRSHLQVMPCVCHPSPWWPWPRTSFINVTWIAQAGWRKRIRMLNLRERSPPFGAGCLSRTRAYHGLPLPNAHQIGCNWCILYTVYSISFYS